MDYLRAHWRGEQSLARSFWVNFALPFLALSLAAQVIAPPLIEHVSTFAFAAGAYLVGCLALYPWQVVGLLRACDRHLTENRETRWTAAVQRVTAIQAVMIAGLVVIAVTVFSLLQDGIDLYAGQDRAPEVDDAVYAMDFVEGGRIVRFEGVFAPGVTKDLRTLLARRKGVTAIILDSDGGRVFEARGMAKVIGEHKLDTYVYGMCRSACTTAFIAGVRRYLGVNGRLGFHQYRLQAVIPGFDVAAEQEKDRAFFQASGVEPALLSKIFQTPHEKIWYPSVTELLEGKVVHQVVCTAGDCG